MKQLTYFYVLNAAGDRLCGDGQCRSFAMFGTYHSCVKVYKSYAYARKAAKNLRTIQGYVLEHVQNGESEINAVGQLWSELDRKAFNIKDLIDGATCESFKLHKV